MDCSFSTTANETPTIPNALIGEVYVMLITNYADNVQDITLSQTGGAGATDCSIVTNPPCALVGFSVQVGGCDFVTNTYNIAGSIDFTDPPTSGDLVVEDCNGNITIVDSYPFGASPQSFNLNGLPSDGLACDVEVYFTTDVACSQQFDYVAPVCVTNCPTYDLNSTSPLQTCGNQLYYLEIQNSGCDGSIYFDVLGNFGSADANEITWQVTSNLSGSIVASGGPGGNGQNINVNVGPLDPTVEGVAFTLTIDDSFGDGFNGTGGYIEIQENGVVLTNTITGNFGATASIVVQVGITVSSSTMTVQTPSGPVVSTIGNCQDHEVEITLNNNNFCTPIVVDMPWVIECDASGTLIASGTHSVTVYPQVPADDSDFVTVTWNTTTCQWDISANNDCDLIDLGTLFTISPDPTTLGPYCTDANENFTINYLGFPGGPDCCSTGGPVLPISYSDTQTTGDVTAEDSPFGGINNAAYVSIPGNGTGGNATAVTLDVDMTGFCVNPSPGNGDSYWVTVYVDGVIIYDQQFPGTTSTFSQIFTLADMPNGYNENSIVEVYIYPNQLGSMTYDPGVTCGSLSNGEWTASTITASLTATYEQFMSTPTNCTFIEVEPYTCCTTVGPIVPADGGSTVACVANAQVQPTAPVVADACGNTLTPVVTVPGAIVCSGTMNWIFTYTDCDNKVSIWTYVYTISVPTYTVPADGSSTVACISDAQTAPVVPTVTDNCGGTLTFTGPIVSADPVCSGNKTYTYEFTDCSGTTFNWVYTYTISAPIYTVPAAGSSTVACISDAQAVPTTPTVTNNCGVDLSVSAPVVSADPVCSGDKTYTFTYTACDGTTFDWVYTYTISAPTYTVPAAGGSTVACVSDAQALPTAPTVTNNCGVDLSVSAPVVSADPVCSGNKTYTFTYTACDGSTFDWVYTYTISAPTYTVPAAGGSTVVCVSDAQVAPAVPTVTDNCGTNLTYTGPVVSADPIGCGVKTYTYEFTDCGGITFNWVYSYTINDNVPPTASNPAGHVNIIR